VLGLIYFYAYYFLIKSSFTRRHLYFCRTPENPAGWVPLVVAENKLGNDIMLNRMNQVTSFPTWVMNYGGFKGTFQLQTAFAGLLNRTFVKEPVLEPDNFCILSGCSGILDNLFYCLADEGESVLIPAPYYPAFDNDLEAKDNLIPVPFFLNESDIQNQLDTLAATKKDEGKPVRVLLLTNPNNPLGTIYSEATVKDMLRWCLKNKVHYVSDEIYALSVYKTSSESTPFVSALTYAQELVSTGEFPQDQVDLYVHLVYGMSKDWCASGLRVGLVYSRNQPLHQAIMSLAGFSGISNHTQHILAEVLSDEQWTTQFVEQNSKLLEGSYDALTEKLTSAGIPFTPAVAGMFVWIDLSAYLPENTWEGEAKLWERVCDECKVILTPGSSCHAKDPGFFRLCFAWVPKDALVDAVDRIEKEFIQKKE
jgi:1-aminocyclopropane-1-carboxylate synthase